MNQRDTEGVIDVMDRSVGHCRHVRGWEDGLYCWNGTVCFLRFKQNVRLSPPISPPCISSALMTPACLVLSALLFGIGMSPVQGKEQTAVKAVSVPDTVGQRVVTAFEDGDPQALLAPSTDRVEVSLLGTQTIYSQAQAFYVLRAFFERHPPSDFTVEDVTMEGTSCFVRGKFDHRSDERTFRVYVRFVHQNEKWRMQEVRVDTGPREDTDT